MSDDTRTYVADSELAALLKAAAEGGKRLRVRANDQTYEVEVTPATESNDIWEGYDPGAAREALYASAGVLAGTGIDVEAWLEEIREARKQDTPGRPPSSLMSFLVDTNVLIYHLNGIANATHLLDRLLEPGAAMSAISYMEVIDGLTGNQRTTIAEQRFTILAERMRILDFKRDDAIVAARIRHALREQGRNVRSRSLDLLIAATALSNNLTLVTNNPSDYQDVPGLRIEVADLHM